MREFVIRRSYVAFLYSVAAVGVGLVLLVAFIPPCNPEDWRWGVADVLMFSAAAAFMVWYGSRMSRLSFQVSDLSFRVCDRGLLKREVPFSSVVRLKNRPRQKGVEVHLQIGSPVLIPHQINGIEELIDLLVDRVGRTVEP
jgi:hypothetical protein